MNYNHEYDKRLFKQNEKKLKSVLKKICTTECTLLDILPDAKIKELTYSDVLHFLNNQSVIKRQEIVKIFNNNVKYDSEIGLSVFDSEVEEFRTIIKWAETSQINPCPAPQKMYNIVSEFLNKEDFYYLLETTRHITQKDNEEFAYLYEEDEKIQEVLEEKTASVLKEICTDTCSILDLIPDQKR